METIETSKLNRTLTEVLGRVGDGEAFILTRYGKGVAYLGPIPDPDPRLESTLIEQAVEKTPGPLSRRTERFAERSAGEVEKELRRRGIPTPGAVADSLENGASNADPAPTGLHASGSTTGSAPTPSQNAQARRDELLRAMNRPKR